MATNFMKTNESTVVETIYEASSENEVSYSIVLRRHNGVLDSVQCSVRRQDNYVGSMQSQGGQKGFSFIEGENSALHAAVFEEFLQTLS